MAKEPMTKIYMIDCRNGEDRRVVTREVGSLFPAMMFFPERLCSKSENDGGPLWVMVNGVQAEKYVENMLSAHSITWGKFMCLKASPGSYMGVRPVELSELGYQPTN